jgi:hypothetical protein
MHNCLELAIYYSIRGFRGGVNLGFVWFNWCVLLWMVTGDPEEILPLSSVLS